MTDASLAAWQFVVVVLLWVGCVSFVLWASYLYVLVLSQGSRKAVLTLNKLEQRSVRAEVLRGPLSHHAWHRFRVKHLPIAEGVWRAEQLLFRPPTWLGFVILVDVLALVGLLIVASMNDTTPRWWDGLTLALAFFSAVPWLSTVLLHRVMCLRRARSEWEVALLGEKLVADARSELDQDFIARRTTRVLGALGRRFPRGRSRQGNSAEGRIWLAKAQPAVQMRAVLVASDVTERREWSGWIDTWLDRVSEAFESRPSSTQPEASALDALPSHDPDVYGLAALVVVCSCFGSVGVALMAFSSGFDMSAALSAWDSTAGRLTTFVGLVGTVLSILSYRRGRSGNSA
ncbi:hypothetical protein [Curtobacterium sp. PsM8]|uniref:hypothetical protein n=1 Tax=Curtobacterium sp. PsM8 TaxID=3030532 RepID=UPI00263AF60C|nr:hypothetical protein [Curtobacterium sp. PsM8]MDN4648370.1 hypothetical protein [Curtobacterium sp. PsM8]